MGVDICRRGEGAVAQPELNLFHGYSITQKEAGTSVPKVMEAYFPQIIFFNDPGKMFCNIIGPQNFSTLIDADVFKIIPAVRLFE